MRTPEEIDKIDQAAHQLEILLSAASKEELSVDETVPSALQIVMGGLDMSNRDKVRVLFKVAKLYI